MMISSNMRNETSHLGDFTLGEEENGDNVGAQTNEAAAKARKKSLHEPQVPPTLRPIKREEGVNGGDLFSRRLSFGDRMCKPSASLYVSQMSRFSASLCRQPQNSTQYQNEASGLRVSMVKRMVPAGDPTALLSAANSEKLRLLAENKALIAKVESLETEYEKLRKEIVRSEGEAAKLALEIEALTGKSH